MTEEYRASANGKEKEKKKKALLILLVLLLLFGSVLALNWNNWFGNIGFNPDLDADASDWTGQKPEDKGGAAVGIKIPGYPSISLPADTKDVTVAFLNPEGNPCYFTFELVLKDTGETLYKSKMVPPGKAITRITMSRPLAAGEYNATIKITTASLDDGSAMNGANVETLLKVQ